MEIIDRHNISRHGYADDTQLYTQFQQKDTNHFFAAVTHLEACIEDVRVWMINNKLKLNEDKTEFIIITSKHHASVYQKLSPTLTVGGVSIRPSATVRNLGVLFDQTMTLQNHVNNIKSSMYFHIREIKRIRWYIDQGTAHMAVQALVLSRMDYSNVLLCGLPNKLLNGLQVAQNTAARLITRSKKREHITPIFKSLHWLPVIHRIKYKCLSLVFKAMYSEKSPNYLQHMLHSYTPCRTLRSGSQTTRLSVSRSSNAYGDRAFSICAPKLWNGLPSDIHHHRTLQSFKQAIKTFLFKSHFAS